MDIHEYIKNLTEPEDVSDNRECIQNILDDENVEKEGIHDVQITTTTDMMHTSLKMRESQTRQDYYCSEPKEVILTDVLTNTLQEVMVGELTNIDNVIGRLRTSYEDKNLFANANVFTNANKRYISLINFEDDTLRPVFKISDVYLDIIKKWYDDCDLLMDVEDTDVFIPENITLLDLSGVLFEDISNKNKDMYLKNYIPLVINNIITNRNIQCMERNLFEVRSRRLCPPVPRWHDFDRLQSPKLVAPKPFRIEKEFPIVGVPFVSDRDPPPQLKETKLKVLGIDVPSILHSKSKNGMQHKPTGDTKIESTNNILPYNDQMAPSNKSDFHLPYNYDFNVLYPSFASACESLTPDYTFIEKPILNEIYVLVHDKFLQTLVIKNPEKYCLHIINYHSEFGFIKLFNISTSNENVINFIQNEYNAVLFNDINEINKKLLVTSQYIEVNDLNAFSYCEESVVKKYLTNKYTIDNDVNHKMKASALYDILISSNAIKIDADKLAGFKTRLSKYLKDIGLQKKRYNDGFYYYGIVEKRFGINSFGDQL